MPKVSLQVLFIRCPIAACGEQIAAGLQLVAGPQARFLPGHGKRAQKPLEELQPRAVDIGVGQCRDLVLHAYDQNVCVGGADVVLDEKQPAVLGRRGAEARVIEFQRCGAIEAFHEGPHQRSPPLRQSVNPRSLQCLVGSLRLQLVDAAVRIHDEQMQAIAALAIARCHRIDAVSGNGSMIDRRPAEVPFRRAASVRRLRSGRHASMVSTPAQARRTISGACGMR